jgi:hypothetical protein
VVAVAEVAVVAVADLPARVVAVDRGAAGVVADRLAGAVGHGAAAAVSRKTVQGGGVEFPRRRLLRHVVRCASTVVSCKTVVSLQDAGSLLARCNAGRRFLWQDLQ